MFFLKNCSKNTTNFINRFTFQDHKEFYYQYVI